MLRLLLLEASALVWGLQEGPCRLLLWLLPQGRVSRPLLLPCRRLLVGPERRRPTLLRLLLLPTCAVVLCWWDVGAVLAKGPQHRLRSSCMPHLLLMPGLLHVMWPLLCLLLPWLLRLRSSAPVLLPTRLLLLVREGVGLLQAAAGAVRLLLLLLCLLLPLNLLCNGIQLKVIKVLQRHDNANQSVAACVVERVGWLTAELQASSSCT